MSKGLGNPALALTTATSFAQSDTGKETIKSVANGAKIILLIAGTAYGIKYAKKEYKKYKAKKYANENVGNPNLVAAAIIYNSFKRIEFPGILGLVLPSIDISTDESALNDVATKITSVKAVSNAYKILFDRNLFFDTQNGLDTEELRTFWNKINAPKNNTDTTTNYPIGMKMYCASKGGIIVNQAKVDANGNWKGTELQYGQFQHGELVGEILAYGKVPEGMQDAGATYYIIKESKTFWFPGQGECVLNCKTGVVLQFQIEPKQ